MKRLLIRSLLVLVGLLVVIQSVPYGRQHTNPPVVAVPAWDSPRTRELAERACFDCHSNETKWRWYSNVAPLSWWLQKHVDKGRVKLNFSDVTLSDTSPATQRKRSEREKCRRCRTC